MKHLNYLWVVTFSLILGSALGQGVAINETGAAAATSAILDVSSTTQGILIPRMTGTQRAGISGPEAGLMVYQTDSLAGYYYYDGTAWSLVGSRTIDDLLDACVTGQSVYLGQHAGENDDGQTNENVGLGYHALRDLVDGIANVAVGKSAMENHETGNRNTVVGYEAGFTSSNSTRNTSLGWRANYNCTGDQNTAIGYGAGQNPTGVFNRDGCVFLGYMAGQNEGLSNKLYIENSSSDTPLIYGEFDNDKVTVYGNLGLGTTSFGGGSRTLALFQGSIPSSSINDGVLLYAHEYISPSGAELRVRDELGNVTTLSPHNFSITEKSEPMAWSFYSENDNIGQRINVDMLRVVRLVEELTGEKLVFINSLNEDYPLKVDNGPYFGLVKQQQEEIQELKQMVLSLQDQIGQLLKEKE